MRDDILQHLQSRAGQPWARVCTSLCDGPGPRRSARQLERLEALVATRVLCVQGRLWSADGPRPMPLAQVPRELYVDPATGLLLRNERGDPDE